MQTLLTTRKDPRGVLLEIAKGDFRQCSIIEMKKGSIWGDHYHKNTKELFFVQKGKITVYTYNINTKSKHRRKIYTKGQTFTIQTNINHTIKALSKTVCVVLYSESFNKRNPDIYHQEQSKYKHYKNI